ncbi:MAG: hypothetical protein NTV84_01580 [Methanoregula sp.]|nr:hypothetical protein [Methanoregula sp.]
MSPLVISWRAPYSYDKKSLSACPACPELMCERFTRFKNPEMSEEEQSVHLSAMERELLGRK